MSNDPVEPVKVESNGVETITTQTNGVQEHTVTKQTHTAKDYFVFRRRFVYAVVAGFVASITIGTLAFFGLFRDSQAQVSSGQESLVNLTEDVTLLREQLGDAQRQLNVNSQENSDLIACRGAFANRVSEATSVILIELTQLLTLLSNEVREDTATAVAEIEAAGVALDASQKERALYEADGAPLPCPIPPSDPPS